MQPEVCQAADAIRSGGVIIYPTEGVYGLGCDPKNPNAVERLLAIKKRNPDKGFILIASTLEMLSEFVAELPDTARKKVIESWPGPVTWILPATDSVPTFLTGNRDTLAVRVSAHPFVVDLCNTLGHAIVSTSANISGQPPAETQEELKALFFGTVDYITPLEPGDLDRPTPIFDARTGEQLR